MSSGLWTKAVRQSDANYIIIFKCGQHLQLPSQSRLINNFLRLSLPALRTECKRS